MKTIWRSASVPHFSRISGSLTYKDNLEFTEHTDLVWNNNTCLVFRTEHKSTWIKTLCMWNLTTETQQCHRVETQQMPLGWNSANAIRLKPSKCHQAETQQMPSRWKLAMPSGWNSANAIRLKLSKCHQAETQQMPSGWKSAMPCAENQNCHQSENLQCHWAERALKLSSLIGLLSS